MSRNWARIAAVVLCLLGVSSAQAADAPALLKILRRPASSQIRPLRGLIQEQAVKHSMAKINLRALKKRFIFNIDGESFEGEPNPKGFRGSRNLLRSRGRKGRSYESISSGALHRLGEQKDDDKHYGDYIFSTVRRFPGDSTSLAASILTPNGRNFSLVGTIKKKRQRIVLRTFQDNSAGNFECGYAEAAQTPPDGMPLSMASDNLSADTPTVKILVAYTREALAQCSNNHATVQAVVNLEIGKIQQSAIDSDLGFAFDAAGSAYFVDEAAPTTAGVAITKLSEHGESSPYAEGIFSEIISRQADIVHLLSTFDGSITGIGFGLKGLTSEVNGRYAFAVSNINSFMYGPSRLFAHETGHVLGGHHDPPNTVASAGPYLDARGHRFTGTNSVTYVTIIAYSGGPDDESLHQYSNPAISYQGVATGISGERDNARMLKFSGPLAAAYSSYNFFNVTGGFESSLIRNAADSGFAIRYRFSGDTTNPTLSGQSLRINLYTSGTTTFSPYGSDVTFTQDWTEKVVSSGTYFVSLYPDINVKGSDITVPNDYDITADVTMQGAALVGQLGLSGGAALNVAGNWITVYLLEISNGQNVYTSMGSPTIGSDGKFSMDLTVAGYYVPGFKSGSTVRYLSGVYFNGLPTPTPTPAATNTPAPGATSTPVPGLTVTNELSLSYKGRKAILNGLLKSGVNLLEGATVQLLCAGNVVKETVSNNLGSYKFSTTRPKKKTACHTLASGEYVSKTVKVKPL